ncbi:MAG: TonB-dependent receptor [Gammaproteobacteria bacterium]|nr:TonB-dependent receptor [Gammaproteobacteria bacterium]
MRHRSIDRFRTRLDLKPAAAACAIAQALGYNAAAHAQDGAALEEVVTTGTRIERSGMNAPTPVTVVAADDLALMAPGNMIEALSQLPLFYGNTSSAAPGNFFTTPGSGNLNLRGIGTNRTLVLLDGRRVVSSTRFGGTDINVFPEAMISTVESVTGGASAAYGTDAVTGVTNFILNTDFEGVSGHAQGGVTSRGDNDNWEASFAFGTPIGEKFHLLFSTDYFEQDGVFTYEDRDWYKAWGLVTNADPNGPTSLVRPYVVSTTATFDGLITAPGTPLHGLNFNSEGTAATPFRLNPESTGTSQSIAGGAGSGDFIGADRPTVAPKFERDSSFLYLDYDVTDNLTLFVQGIYGNSTTTSNNGAGQFQAFFSPMTIYSGNAFLPDSIQQIMDDNGIGQFTLNRMGHSSDLGRGGASTIQDTTLSSRTLGIEAEFDTDGFFDGWRMDGYYQYGESKTKSSQVGGIRIDRIHMAHDAVVDPATGAIVCNVTLVSGLYPDCVPLNPFGRGNMSQAAIDWVTGFDPGQRIETPLYYTQSGYDLGLTDSYVSESAKVVRATIVQEVFELTFNGEIFENFKPGAISLAFGAGYREERMNQIVRSPALPDGNHDTGRPVPPNDPALGIRGQAPGDVNNSVAIQYSKVPNIRGKMDVTEFFGELFVPLVADSRLDLSLAARHADYSGSGGVSAYKLGLASQLTDSFRLRATASHDVRAGTLSERFDQTGSAGSVMDPFDGNAQVNIFQTSGGDPNIRPEEADTVTIGAVYQPGWAEGLSLSVDWYEVSLEDAISSLTSQQVLDQCFAGDQSLCARVHRLPDGTINLIQANVLNVAKAKVSGVDFEVGYRRSVNWFGGGEAIGFRLLASHLTENSTQGFQSPVIDRAGQLNLFEFPKDKYVAQINYSNGPFAAFLQARRVDDGYRDVLQVEGVDIDDNTIDSVTYLDLNLRYELEAGDGAWEFYGSINNLTDEDPPVVPNFGFFGATANQTNAGLHDLLGRRYTVGARFSF